VEPGRRVAAVLRAHLVEPPAHDEAAALGEPLALGELGSEGRPRRGAWSGFAGSAGEQSGGSEEEGGDRDDEELGARQRHVDLPRGAAYSRYLVTQVTQGAGRSNMDENREQDIGDYSYDEAHDVRNADAHASPAHHDHPVQVPTQSRDEAGDYSYDLAHEVPPA
jgi:hypothetical protein